MSGKFDGLVKGAHALDLLFVVKLSIELAFAGLDATKLEPCVEDTSMASVELAAGLVALDCYLQAIVNRTIWVITIQIVLVLSGGDGCVGEVLFPAGRFTLSGVSRGKEVIDACFLPSALLASEWLAPHTAGCCR